MKYISLASFLWFIAYSFASLLLLGAFGKLYLWLTPYHEVDEIRKGNMAPAIAFGGALLGFTFPVLSVMHNGVNFLDFVIWAAVAGVVQLGLFKVLYWIIPMQIEEDNRAIAVIYASLALCVGLINAFSLIPS